MGEDQNHIFKDNFLGGRVALGGESACCLVMDKREYAIFLS
jgi:hypothetical protein